MRNKNIQTIYLLLTGAEDYNFNRAKKLIKLLEKKSDISNSLVIITGLSSFDSTVSLSEAKMYEQYIERNCNNVPEIILEEKAVDTLGNFVFSHSIISDIVKKQSNFVTLNLITEDFHMNRSKWIFEQVFSDIRDSIEINCIRVRTKPFQKLLYYMSLPLLVLLVPFLLFAKLFSKNVYLKDFILLKLIQRDISCMKLKSSKDVKNFILSFSPYKKSSNTILKKSIYAKIVEYISK